MPESKPEPSGRQSLGRALGQGWALFLAGFVALAGGVSLLVNPDAGLRLVKLLVGLFLAGWGVLRVVHAVRTHDGDRTWLMLSGVTVLLAGVVVLTWPAITLAVLVDILVIGGLSLAAVDLVGAVLDRRRNSRWWWHLLRGVGTLLLVAVLLVWPDETLSVVRVLAAILLILWGASAIGEAYGSPVRDNQYRGQLDREVRRII